MTRVLALVPDLLFGSNLQGALAAGGQETVLLGDGAALRDALRLQPAEVLIVDLTDEELVRVQTVKELREEGLLAGVALLAFYSHVEPAVREMALAAGFDLVVPRSRMARDAPELVAGVKARSPRSEP